MQGQRRYLAQEIAFCPSGILGPNLHHQGRRLVRWIVGQCKPKPLLTPVWLAGIGATLCAPQLYPFPPDHTVRVQLTTAVNDVTTSCSDTGWSYLRDNKVTMSLAMEEVPPTSGMATVKKEELVRLLSY